ncbi:hypothetical protein A2988_02895 [Candidatus Azambacteria bacterium RIFCSPLOWO2_01_FULL_46_25]|uniref:UDP-N-acetylmuramyl-tripeptide synthetase n=1 Tax=Candidatus Azambacteria bacterium RIFCSPLOWO2_01_FULL_46_25 TaxID=1797298 RepID=A0A1F5BUX7_9BACT|nr:MAG: hypothetical protein A2988_02895 [Candidatus Azambacteria bacterium RIFCSPLOWO2_01_FULL_46_25]OGD37276.1 MAG: hypothetical protein A2850_00995 [Candidatus Azambacteria bacterium RIFCSPHIGHO2_01_FULL_51_74]
MAFLAALWYSFPSEGMVVVGVTGTKGKSSTIFMLSKILEEAGMKVAVSSSLMFKIKENEWLNPYHMTMAGRFKLQEFLYQAKQAGCTHVLIETTSEGIKQYRHKFINFDVAIFTNLTPEHIEAHGGFENYKRAKGKLFEALASGSAKKINGAPVPKIAVLNMDDPHAEYFMRFGADKKYGFGLKGTCKLPAQEQNACVFASLTNSDAAGIAFTVGHTALHLPLLGQFNIYNALCAVVAAQSLGVNADVAKEALKKVIEIPGRMKFVQSGQKFSAIIDLAHTPSSFEAVFETAQAVRKEKGRIVAVFGAAGGGRDKWKRPELGSIAAKNADHIILTNEDPYDEAPRGILEQIKGGITAANFRGPVEIVEDRTLAIRHAVNLARWNDVVLFLGKGTEQTMVLRDATIPWNEEEVVAVEIRNMLYDRK